MCRRRKEWRQLLAARDFENWRRESGADESGAEYWRGCFDGDGDASTRATPGIGSRGLTSSDKDSQFELPMHASSPHEQKMTATSLKDRTGAV